MRFIPILALLFALHGGFSALAQPFERRQDGLMRMADILGALHHLRAVCNKGEGNLWRERMFDILRSDGVDNVLQAQLTERFNAGNEKARLEAPQCTVNAIKKSDVLVREGELLARDLVTKPSQN